MEPLKILLIEDQDRYARIVLDQLRGSQTPSFEVVLHYQYETAPALLNGKGGGFDVVLFGFQGEEDLATARKVLKQAEGKALVFFLLKNNNKKSIDAVTKLGTSRFLIKRDLQACILARVLEYEMEVIRLLRHSDDQPVTDGQVRKVTRMVESLVKEVRNPSSIVRLAMAPFSSTSGRDGRFDHSHEVDVVDVGQIKSFLNDFWTGTLHHDAILPEGGKVKTVHQKAG